MKRSTSNILLILPLIFLSIVSCGPSEQEKADIAKITCNIIGESRNMDAVVRIKEINSAREKIGEEPFLGSDDQIKKAYQFGFCIDLVLNKADYSTLLTEGLELQRLIDEEVRKKREEELKKKQEEQKIIAAQNRQKKQEEEKRKAAELERKRLPFNDAITEYFNNYPLTPELIAITSYGHFNAPGVMISINCSSSNGFYHEVIVKTKDSQESATGLCKASISNSSKEGVIIKVPLKFTYKGENKTRESYPINHPILDEIESVLFRLTGELNYDYLDFKLSQEQLSRLNPLNYGLTFDDEFTIEYEFELLKKQNQQ